MGWAPEPSPIKVATDEVRNHLVPNHLRCKCMVSDKNSLDLNDEVEPVAAEVASVAVQDDQIFECVGRKLAEGCNHWIPSNLRYKCMVTDKESSALKAEVEVPEVVA